ncbi:unnamed protein product [Rhodiola kirilowii]
MAKRKLQIPLSTSLRQLISNPASPLIPLSTNEGKYKDWQKKLHPDLVHSKSQKEKDYAAEQSSRVIDAYRKLENPLSRAIYMLKLKGIDVDEEQTISEPELLGEIMDIREAVEEAVDSQALTEIQIQMQEKLKHWAECFARAFQDQNLEVAKSSIQRMTYYESASIVNNVNTSIGYTSVGEEEYTLHGKSTIAEKLRGLTFQISANSFFQTNTHQAEVLYKLIEDCSGLKGDGSEVVLDLFCGTGTIGLTLARRAKHIYGYEVVPQAISDAPFNAKLNGIENATFVQGDLNKIDENFGNNFPKPDIVISDPNRPGMHLKLIKFLLKLKAPRIVYVSCNPATCARDLDYLCHGWAEKKLEGCYKLGSVQPVDMFPHAPHIDLASTPQVDAKRCITAAHKALGICCPSQWEAMRYSPTSTWFAIVSPLMQKYRMELTGVIKNSTLDSSTCGSPRVTKNLNISQVNGVVEVNGAVKVQSTVQLRTGVKYIVEIMGWQFQAMIYGSYLTVISSMSGETYSNPPKLKPGEYETWTVKFEAHVMAMDGEVWQIIEQGQQYIYLDETETELKPRLLYTTADYKKLEKNARALKVLHSALEPGDLKKVIQFKDPSDIWDSLKKIYEGSKDVKRNRILAVQSEFNSLRQDVAALPTTKENSLEELVAALDSNKTIEDVKLERREPQKSARQIALVGESSRYRKFKGKDYQRNRGKEVSRTEELTVMTKALRVTDDKYSGRKPSNRNDSMKNVECFYCKKKGHYKKDCYKLKNDESRTDRNQKEDIKGKKAMFAWGDSDDDNNMGDLRRNVCLMAKGSPSSSETSSSTSRSKKTVFKESSTEVSSDDSEPGYYSRSECIAMIKKLVLKAEELNAIVADQDQQMESMFEENHQLSIQIQKLDKAAGKRKVGSDDQFFDSPKGKEKQKPKSRPGLGYGEVSIAKPMQRQVQQRSTPRLKVELDNAKTYGKGYHIYVKLKRRNSPVPIDFEHQKKKVSESKAIDFRKQKVCLHCGREGHSQRRCRERKNISEEDSETSSSESGNCSVSKRSGKSSAVKDPSSSRTVKDVSHSKAVTKSHVERGTGSWLIDSACSGHMTGKMDLFSSLQHHSGGSITFGNESKCKVIGSGKVHLSNKVSVDNVSLVNGLKFNLLSVSQLCRGGKNKVVFTADGCFVKCVSSGQVLLRINCANRVYFVDPSFDPEEYLCLSSRSDESEMWHRRLGHVNFRLLKRLHNQNLVIGLPKISEVPDQVCSACAKGKQTRSSFHSKNVVSTHKAFELIHMDLCGPMRVQSRAGNRYVFVIVDDYSRYTWVIFIRSKDEVFDSFKTWVKLVKRRFGEKLKSIRTDHGTEFDNGLFVDFCKDQGIDHNFSAPRTPQQNGVVERKNRTLEDMTRTMLLENSVARNFWAEAMNAACHVLNRCYLRPFLNKTPYELLKGRKPNVSQLRVFGCRCYVHVNGKDRLGKFDPKSDEEIFVGYSLHSKAYKVFNKRTKKVEESVHVIFDEESTGTDSGQVPDIHITEVGDNFELIRPRDVVEVDGPENQEIPDEENGQVPEVEEPGQQDEVNEQVPEEGEVHDEPEEIQQTQEVTELRRSTQLRQPSVTLRDYICYAAVQGESVMNAFVSLIEPKSVQEALKDPDWIQAMQDELHQFERNKVWRLVPRPEKRKVIGTRWILRNKRNSDGEVVRNKARLVVKGYSQQEGIDYEETFAQVARLEAIRLLIAYSVQFGIKLHQMDVKTAFLNGFLKEEIFVEQTPGFEVPEHPDHVYVLDKALYGLKQAPRAWYERLSKYLLAHGYERGKVDKTLFLLRTNKHLLIVQVYVDDIIFGSTSDELVKSFTKLMESEFEMSMVGELTFFLGIQVRQLENGTEISQQKYLSEVVKKYGLGDSKHVNTPSSPNESLTKDNTSPRTDATRYRGMIGSLLYLTASRPDIMFSVCQCARFQADPRESHVKAVKRILRYLKGTEKLVLWYPRVKSLRLEGFTDADFAGDKTDRKSTSGMAQFLGSCLVSWGSKKQNSVALSTAEAEYIAAAACCAQVLWLRNQLSDFNLHFDQVPIFCDNTSAISIAKNHVQHGKSKHIEIKHHFLRDCVEKELVTINFCRSEDQVADIFTKSLHKDAFEKLRMELGLMTPQ